MFLGYQDEKIALVADTREELENNKYMKFDNIVESVEDYVLYKGEYLPKSTAEAQQAADEKAARIADLQKQLDVLDLKAIRALRAIQAGVGTADDTTRLAELESQAEYVRQQIRQLED